MTTSIMLDIAKDDSHRSFRSASRQTGQASGLCFPAFLLAVFFLSLLTSPVHADDISVSAALSATATTTDQPVRLTITASGGMNADIPSEIQADGLDIQYSGQSRRIEMMNFRGSVSVINTYIVSASNEGTFTIPPIEIQAGGKTYKTDPLTLKVTKGSPASQGAGTASDSTASKIFAELVIPKDTAYVGEIIPTEVRFYFDGDVNFQVNPPGQVPQISGEGFSKLRYPQPRVEQTEIKGRPYRVVIYKTAIVAAKSGELNVGPAEQVFVVSMPQTRQRRSIFNDPLADDMFNNSFFNQRIEREMSVRTDPVKITVKALPPGRPPSFSGAVGQFTLATTATPSKVKTGDPVTLNATIAGRGNFDLVNAPKFPDTPGWRTYPPSGTFSSTDEMGITGDKKFAFAVIPESPMKEIPPVEFTYFDPAQEKFITLHSQPIPVQVEGNAIVAAPSPSPTLTAEASPTPRVEAEPTPQANGLLPNLTRWREQPQTFTPVWQQPVFWAAQGVPLLLLLGLMGPKIRAALQPQDAVLKKRRALAELKALQEKMRSDQPDIFYPAAARWLEIRAAQEAGPDAEPITALGLQDEEAEAAREIFRRSDELAYGGGKGGREISTEQRARFAPLFETGGVK